MAVVGLLFKRTLNNVHNYIQNTILPLEVHPASEHPLALNMSASLQGGLVGGQQLLGGY